MLEDDKYLLVDKASEWLLEKDASYLSKENKIVYMASLTGRKGDRKWYYLSIAEAVRVISACSLSADSDTKLSANHLLTAAQELERVFDMGIRSPHKTPSNIFNYLDKALSDLPSAVMLGLCRELTNRNYLAFRIPDLVDIYSRLNIEIGLHQHKKDVIRMYQEHLPDLGYKVRSGTNRVILQGKKQTVAIKVGLQPKHVQSIPEGVKRQVYKSLIRQYK